jgi:hypothetical protein
MAEERTERAETLGLVLYAPAGPEALALALLGATNVPATDPLREVVWRPLLAMANLAPHPSFFATYFAAAFASASPSHESPP